MIAVPGTVVSTTSWGLKMPLQPMDRLIQNIRPLTEREPGVVPRRARFIVESRNRDRRHAGLFRDMAAERHIVAVEPQRREVGGDEICPTGRQNRQPHLRQAGGKLV